MDWKRTWVLVIDHARARIVRRASPIGIAGYNRDDIILRRTGGRRFLREYLEDDCVRSGARSTLAVKARDQDVRDFAETIVGFLDAHRIAGDYDTLILFAGMPLIRHISVAMPQGLRRCTISAVPADTPQRLGRDWWRGFRLPDAALH
jgi:hypothetical protein